MAIPHQFQSFVEGPIQAVVIAGTGLSAPNVMVLKSKLDSIASDLELSSDEDFYSLAETVLDVLCCKGRTDSESRLWLAEQLGLLDDRRWFGELGLPLSGNTPRHRALARFVIEERLHAIVSLNWDTLLEAALDSVGLNEGVALPRPWRITNYSRVVDNTHMPKLAHANVFPVIKPHGCVRELERLRKSYRSGDTSGAVTFKLTSTEMGELTTDQENAVHTNVKDYIAKYPLIGIGWSAGETYLREAIIEIAEQVNRTENDAFTIIDLEWNNNHTEIASAYGKNKLDSFAQVSRVIPTTDCLMQWLQARHALVKIINMVTASEQVKLKQLLMEIEQPDCKHLILSWADYWLPSWVRVCWRAGAMLGVDPQTNKQITPNEIPVVPRDNHIPLTGMSIERRDLHAAAKFLTSLPSSLNKLRFDLYPGGVLDMSIQCLYIPLPGWKVTGLSSDLAALKPLVDALKGLGYVRKIYLILLNNQSDQPDMKLQHQLEAQFRSLMPLASFAAGDAVSWLELDDLKARYNADNT